MGASPHAQCAASTACPCPPSRHPSTALLPLQNPNLVRPMPEPKQSVEEITQLVSAARSPGVKPAEMDPEVELDGMDADEELMATGGSGANYAV